MVYKHKYNGYFTQSQIDAEKKDLHRLMYWLLVYKDPKTADTFPNIDLNLSIKNIMNRLQGFCELINSQNDLIIIMSLLESALIETKKEPFDFKNYRKIVLDAHSVLDNIGSDNNDRFE